MRALLEGRVAPTDPAMQHIDQCLGCRGCETACPSGVPYGALLEATRATIATQRPLPLVARAMLAVFAREWLLRPALLGARLLRDAGLARWASRIAQRSGNAFAQRLAMPLAMLASTARDASRRDLMRSAAEATTHGSQASTPHDSTPHGSVARPRTALLTGCVMEGLFTDINRATSRVLERNGHRVIDAPGQVCCGALHAHAGDDVTARALARTNIAAFEQSGAEFIALNSAGCGAMCKSYGHLLASEPRWAARAAAFSARVRDASELLAAAGPIATPAVAHPVNVAWDAPCHLEHGQRVVEPPLQLLRATGTITLRPLAGSDQCCGSAGIYNLVQPDVAERVLDPKLAAIAESGADVVATANPGCLMQIGGGLVLAGSQAVARHPIELLDDAYASLRQTR
jgi:glycolate oxidase iron-sulfur subunit